MLIWLFVAIIWFLCVYWYHDFILIWQFIDVCLYLYASAWCITWISIWLKLIYFDIHISSSCKGWPNARYEYACAGQHFQTNQHFNINICMGQLVYRNPQTLLQNHLFKARFMLESTFTIIYNHISLYALLKKSNVTVVHVALHSPNLRSGILASFYSLLCHHHCQQYTIILPRIATGKKE